jgi:hypothetical protein
VSGKGRDRLTRELDDLIVGTVTPEDGKVLCMRRSDLQNRIIRLSRTHNMT